VTYQYPLPVSIDDQRAAVKREIAFRERLYPRWIEKGRMTQEKADHELRVMRAVLQTLERIIE
jgi:hypothetical protein